mgnify:CR=1 FL=1|jgi:hypothetical protein
MYSFVENHYFYSMVIKVGKKESARIIAQKLKKATAKTKKINWDKYFGKIDFPVDAITYQRKMRDEWGK